MILNKLEFYDLLKDYNRVLGDIIPHITRKYKNKIGKCEHCSIINGPFDYAHRKGNERPRIIKNLFNKHSKIINDKIDLNLNSVKNEFKYIHEFNPSVLGLVLCKNCHNKYDGRGGKSEQFSKTK